MMTIKFAYLSK